MRRKYWRAKSLVNSYKNCAHQQAADYSCETSIEHQLFAFEPIGCDWPFRSHNTCYVRALTLYRFINAPNQQVGIHFGIEQRNDPKERLRGHAWVSIDGEVVEGPQDQITGKLIEMPIGGSRT